MRVILLGYIQICHFYRTSFGGDGLLFSGHSVDHLSNYTHYLIFLLTIQILSSYGNDLQVDICMVAGSVKLLSYTLLSIPAKWSCGSQTSEDFW